MITSQQLGTLIEPNDKGLNVFWQLPQESQDSLALFNLNFVPYMDHVSENLQIAYITDHFFGLQNINNPCDEAILLSSAYNAEDILQATNPTQDYYLRAIKQNNFVIFYIKQPCNELITAALDTNINLARSYHKIDCNINNIGETLQSRFLSRDPKLIKLINKPSLNLHKIVIESDYRNINLIKDPCQEVINLFKNEIEKKYKVKL